MEYELPALALMCAGICIGWLAASAIYYRRLRLARWDAKNDLDRAAARASIDREMLLKDVADAKARYAVETEVLRAQLRRARR